MIEINSLDQCNFEDDDEIVVALGFFDGLHLAHQEIINTCKERARQRKGKALIFTFQNHPRTALDPSNPVPLLTPYPLKYQLIQAMKVDVIAGIPFDVNFSKTTAEEFVHDILHTKLSAKEVIVGYNFHFGYQRKGNTDYLKQQVPTLFQDITVIEQQSLNQLVISSTVIREKIAEGDLEATASMLGRPYQLAGTVIKGDGRGRAIGIPTANINISRQVLPPNGVYGVRVRIDSLKADIIWGVMNIGYVPTFKDQAIRSAEVHLLDYEGDLYNHFLIVDILTPIREERKFSGVDALIEQIHNDIDTFREWIRENQE